MVGAGETYLPAFGLKAGMSEVLAGFFAIVPMVAGSVIQLATPMIVSRVASVKKWVVWAVAIQAAAFLPLIYFSIYSTSYFYILFIVAALYWAAGFASGPSWNFWMGYLVPETESTKFFARRLRLSQMGILLGLMGGGFALHAGIDIGPFSSMFAVLFTVAFLARAASSLTLHWQDYHPDWNFAGHPISLIDTVKDFLSHREYRRFFGFLFVFYVVIFISSPFVSPYFLKKLNLDYRDYMLALAGLFFGKIFSLPLAQPLIRKFGLKNVFFIGALGIAPLPAMWALNSSLSFVVALQAVSGVFWALFEVSLSMIFFNQIKSHNKLSVLTLYNFFNSGATLIGTLLGGWILHRSLESLEGYYFIFEFGAALRLAAVLVFLKVMSRHYQFLSEPLSKLRIQHRVSGPLSLPRWK